MAKNRAAEMNDRMMAILRQLGGQGQRPGRDRALPGTMMDVFEGKRPKIPRGKEMELYRDWFDTPGGGKGGRGAQGLFGRADKRVTGRVINRQGMGPLPPPKGPAGLLPPPGKVGGKGWLKKMMPGKLGIIFALVSGAFAGKQYLDIKSAAADAYQQPVKSAEEMMRAMRQQEAMNARLARLEANRPDLYENLTWLASGYEKPSLSSAEILIGARPDVESIDPSLMRAAMESMTS